MLSLPDLKVTDICSLPGNWEESLLQTSSAFKALSRLFGRGSEPPQGAFDSDRGSPLQALSITSHISERHAPVAFVVSRDRKLRVWDLITDTCVRTVDLPEAPSSASTARELAVRDASQAQAQGGGASDAIFSADARPLMQIQSADADDESNFDTYLMVHIPRSGSKGSFFAYYGLELSSAGRGASNQSGVSVGDLVRLWDAPAPAEALVADLELRDFALLPFGASGVKLWALWDDNGSPMLQYRTVLEEQTESAELSFSRDDPSSSDSPAPWSKVSTWRPHLPLHGPDFESSVAAVEETREALAEFFLERVFEAGRFSQRAITAALAAYEDELLEAFAGYDFLPAALQAETTFESIREHLAAVVGCNCNLATDETAGNPLVAQYLSSLKREWMKAIGIIEEMEAAARWPIALVRPVHPAQRASQSPSLLAQPLMLTRDYLATIDVDDLVSAVGRIKALEQEGRAPKASRRTGVQASAASQEEAFLLSDKSDAIASRVGISALSDYGPLGPVAFGVIGLSVRLTAELPSFAKDRFRLGLRLALKDTLKTSIDDVIGGVWEDAFADSMSADAFEYLSEGLAALGDAEHAVRLFTVVIPDSAYSPDIKGRTHPSTEVEAAWIFDSLVATMHARRRAALDFIFLLGSILLSGGLEEQIEGISRHVAGAAQALQALDSALQIAGAGGRPEAPELSILKAEGIGAADNVALQLESMNVSQKRGAAKAALRGPCVSPLHYAIQRNLLEARLCSAEAFRESEEITRPQRILYLNSNAFLSKIAYVRENVPSLSPAMASLAASLLTAGYLSAAESILGHFPPSLSSTYLKALLSLSRGAHDEAATAFQKILHVVASPETLVEDASGLLQVLPPLVAAHAPSKRATALLARSICNHFHELGSLPGTAFFGNEALVNGIDSIEGPHSPLAEEIWFRTFRTQLDLGDFKAAYRTIMMSRDGTFRRDCVRNLVTSMCEAGQVADLLHFNFASLQSEIEDTLSFKARNSDPFSTPDYFKILYAYHMHRGDLKSGESCCPLASMLNRNTAELTSFALPLGTKLAPRCTSKRTSWRTCSGAATTSRSTAATSARPRARTRNLSTLRRCRRAASWQR